MKGYNDKRRKLFIRITATVLAVMMVATVFSVLLFDKANENSGNPG